MRNRHTKQREPADKPPPTIQSDDLAVVTGWQKKQKESGCTVMLNSCNK